MLRRRQAYAISERILRGHFRRVATQLATYGRHSPKIATPQQPTQTSSACGTYCACSAMRSLATRSNTTSACVTRMEPATINRSSVGGEHATGNGVFSVSRATLRAVTAAEWPLRTKYARRAHATLRCVFRMFEHAERRDSDDDAALMRLRLAALKVALHILHGVCGEARARVCV